MDRDSIFVPTSQLTFDTVPLNSKKLLNYLRNQDVSVIKLDLSGVLQCDSAGLALLLEAKRLAHAYKKIVVIESMPSSIETLAHFCGINNMLHECAI